MFDVFEELDELRTHSTEWLQCERRKLVLEQRRLHTKELTIIRVLDERGAIEATLGESDGLSDRTARETLETARALEALPAIAAAAYYGALSTEQLAPTVQLADQNTDQEWAQRAARMGPADLARTVRTKSKPTVQDSRARHDARMFRTWWQEDRGMLAFRGELPDVLGAEFLEVLTRQVERMKPASGEPFDTLDHRQADALMEMCAAWKAANPAPTLSRPWFAVQIPPEGPAEIAGIPLADELVEQLRASARIEPVLVDDAGAPLAVGRQTNGLSPKIQRAVLLRDGHCRCRLGCELCWDLHVHHLRPRSWGGSDDISNLAAVAAVHHPMLIPHGPYALVGNPNQPDGLRMVHISNLTPEEAEQVGLPPPRDGPMRR